MDEDEGDDDDDYYDDDGGDDDDDDDDDDSDDEEEEEEEEEAEEEEQEDVAMSRLQSLVGLGLRASELGPDCSGLHFSGYFMRVVSAPRANGFRAQCLGCLVFQVFSEGTRE